MQYYKGRGALSNTTSRFDEVTYQQTDEEYYQRGFDKPNTQYIVDKTKSIVSFNKSPDIPFDQSVNPYRGCEHGCVYCYARPTHSYLGYSAGLDFETKIIVKPNSIELLKKHISKKNYQVSPIAFGTNTDVYQPIEKKLKIMRNILELLNHYRHPISIVTKSGLICRDIDLLSQMAKNNLCHVAISVTSLNHRLTNKLEPRASAPKVRINIIRKLSDAHIPVAVFVAPVIPFINDHEIEAILKTAADNGAQSASYIFLRLPHETKTLFRQWLENHYPDKVDHVFSLIKQSRNGKEYQNEFGSRMSGSGLFAELIKNRFTTATKKLGLNTSGQNLNRQLFFKPSDQDEKQLQLWS